MIAWANNLLDSVIKQIPGGDTCIFGFEIGLMTYKIALLCILGEAAILLAKEGKA